MPEQQLEKIEERKEAATKGPWWLTENDSIKGWLDRQDVPGWYTIGGMAIKEDSKFVIHARQDIPNLLAEVRRSHAEVKELRERVERLEEMLDSYEALLKSRKKSGQKLSRENAELRERVEEHERSYK